MGNRITRLDRRSSDWVPVGRKKKQMPIWFCRGERKRGKVTEQIQSTGIAVEYSEAPPTFFFRAFTASSKIPYDPVFSRVCFGTLVRICQNHRDSYAPKPDKATKPKATKQSKPLAPKATPVTKPAAAKAPKTTASRSPKPTPATTEPSKKDQSKKLKLVKESYEAPSLAKRPKASKVIKKQMQKSSHQLVDEFIDERVPVNEPRFGDEEVDLQKTVEESLKDVHAAHQGPLPPVVIREPESRKFQPLPEVPGKGKEKINEEQAAQVLLNLQTPKKKSLADQYIFQRRSSAPTEPSGHDESSLLYEELGLTNSEIKSDDEVPGIYVGDQDEC
ncbi:hypothetical protein Tco_0655078 [Tanacetum coccineum]|uniref:Uncharacterized protein n=1 Tax=Tanacetum coccineum TaxID=301880 RepID=A0ABQ4X543_9ASTR